MMTWKIYKNIIVKPEDGNETKEEIENNTETIMIIQQCQLW